MERNDQDSQIYKILCVTNRKLSRGNGAADQKLSRENSAANQKLDRENGAADRKLGRENGAADRKLNREGGAADRELSREDGVSDLDGSEFNPVQEQICGFISGSNAKQEEYEIFLRRLDCIAANHPAGIILREKDLSEPEYELLAGKVMEICARHDVCCILHSYADVASRLRAEAFHAPLPVLRCMPEAQRKQFHILGASCHSVGDALEAERLGCTYLTAGHIFATDCKKGLPGRGLVFLREVCASVSIPVWAIGGIDPSNAADVRRAGAAGVCVMSGLMQCEDVAAEMEALSGSD